MNKGINRRILGLAWPAIATNITTPLLSLVDVAIVGHIDGGGMIGAVAVGGTMFNILYWVFAFLRMGTSGMTAQAYGADNVAEQRRVLARGGIVAIAGGVLLLVLAPVAGPAVLNLVDGGDAVGELAWAYFSVAVLGAPGVLATYVISGWLLGMQRSRPIMWIALAANVLNITLSATFVYVFGWGIQGVAAGTAVAQIAGALIGVCVVRGVLRKRPAPGWYSGLWARQPWKSFFKVNSDIFLRTVCLASVTLWFTHAGAVISVDVLAANALLMQLFLIFSYFMDGFAFGGEALAGRYYGARDNKSLRLTIRALFGWGVAASLVFTTLYFLCGDVLLGILTDDADVLGVAADYRLWAVTIPLAGFGAFVWDGIFIGMTCTRYLLISMATAMILFFGTYFGASRLVSDPSCANHLLWLAFVVYLASRGATSMLLYRRMRSSLYCKNAK